MFTRILVPLDGSDLAEAVLPHVEELASKLGARVVLLRVVTSLSRLITMSTAGTAPAAGGVPAMQTDLMTEAHQADLQTAHHYLASIRDRLERRGIPTETIVDDGDAATVILGHAADASLIAMSTHGRGGLTRMVIGSVADEVLRSAPYVPMLLVRGRIEE
jgi:nucleotide-binding universal stress UspA family protein